MTSSEIGEGVEGMRVRQTARTLGAVLLMMPLLLYTRQQWQRSPRVSSAQELFAGVTYQRRVVDADLEADRA